MTGKKQVRIQSPLNLEYLLLNEMNCGTNKDVVFLCSGGKKVGYIKSLLCASFPLFRQVLPSCDSEKFLPKDHQIFVTMDDVEAELLVEYFATAAALSCSDREIVDLRFSELDLMLKHFQVHDHDRKEEFSDMFETLINEILEDCVRVRKSESVDSDIIQELDSKVEEEMEPTAKLTMSCIQSKSPAQFYRSYSSEPEKDILGLDFDDLEVKMENSITGIDDIVDEIIDEFCNSDSSIVKQPIVQVEMDVIREVLADPIDESLTVTDPTISKKDVTGSNPIDADAECSALATTAREPVMVLNDSTPVEHLKTSVDKLEINQDSDSHVKGEKPSENETTVVETKIRKRCQLTLVKTKEQIEWEKFPEKLGLIRKINPGEKNKSKIPKKIQTRRPVAETSLVSKAIVSQDAPRERVKKWLAESSSSTSPELQSSSSGVPEPLHLHCPQPQSPISSTAPEPPSSGKREPLDLPPLLSPLSQVEEQSQESPIANEEVKRNIMDQADDIQNDKAEEPSLLDSIEYLMGDVEGGKLDDNLESMMDCDKHYGRDANVFEAEEDSHSTKATIIHLQSNIIDEEITFNPTRKVVPGPAIIDEDTVPDPGLAFSQGSQEAAVGHQVSTYEPMLPSREWDYSDTEINEMFQTCLDEELGNTTEYSDATQGESDTNPEGDKEKIMDQANPGEAMKTLIGATSAADNSLESDVTLGDSYEDTDDYDYEDDEDYDEEISKLETQIDVMKQKAEETLIVPPVTPSEKPPKSKKRRAEESIDEGEAKKSRSEVFEFQCYFCDKSFKRVDDLLQHLSQSHFGKELFSKYPLEADETCPICVSEDRKRKYVLKDVKNKGPYFYHIGKVHQRVIECLEPHHQLDLIKKLNAEPSSFPFLSIPAIEPSKSVSLEEASVITIKGVDGNNEMSSQYPEDDQKQMSDVVLNKEALNTEAPTENNETSNMEKSKKKRGRKSRLNKIELDGNMEVIPESTEAEKAKPSKSEVGESAPNQREESFANSPAEALTSENVQEPVKKGRKSKKSKEITLDVPDHSTDKELGDKEAEASLNASNRSNTDSNLSVAETDKSELSQTLKSPNLNTSKGRGRHTTESIPIACSLCDKPDTKMTKGKLMEHLPTHFTKQINEKYDSNFVENGQCILCVREEKSQPFPCQDIQKKRYNFNRHLSSVHKVALEFLIHEEQHREMIEFLGETFCPLGQENIGDPEAVVTENTEQSSKPEAEENVIKTPSKNCVEDQVKPAAKKPTRIPRKRKSVSNNHQKPVDELLQDLGSSIQITKRQKIIPAPFVKPNEKPNTPDAESSFTQKDIPEPLSKLSSMLTIEKKPPKTVSVSENPSKSFQCGECPAILESKLVLAKHMKSHMKK